MQWVNRPNLDFRGFSGLIGGGNIRPGDIIRILPAGRDTRVARIVTYDGDLERGVSGQSVTLTLTEEIDISRGDLLCSPVSPAKVGDRLEAKILWLVREPLIPGKSYLLKIGTKITPAHIVSVDAHIEIETGLAKAMPIGAVLNFNEMGEAKLALETAVACDPFTENRETGGFILIDRITNETIAVGMVRAITTASGRATPALTDLSYASMEGVPVAPPAGPLAGRNGKMASFTLTSALLTTALAYVFVKETTIALEIGLSQTLALAGLYFLHEKLWRAPTTQSDENQKATIIDGGGL